MNTSLGRAILRRHDANSVGVQTIGSKADADAFRLSFTEGMQHPYFPYAIGLTRPLPSRFNMKKVKKGNVTLKLWDIGG